ncbi:hypothetical protein [Actinophytocola oryzae]|uniref:hypothetical protein n=1 Tax=Actinophytocola oryzae TaxID=502181 RepID=UPI00106241C0|nr:hypothetical protein [Actinophytocola oryzae]
MSENQSGSDAERERLAREFTEEMYEGYRYLARTINYRAKQFLEMVTLQGGVGAAQALLRGRDASDGFTRLWQENMLDRSVEASVLRPKYEPLFTDQERDIARRRLEAHEFDVDGFLASIQQC